METCPCKSKSKHEREFYPCDVSYINSSLYIALHYPRHLKFPDPCCCSNRDLPSWPAIPCLKRGRLGSLEKHSGTRDGDLLGRRRRPHRLQNGIASFDRSDSGYGSSRAPGTSGQGFRLQDRRFGPCKSRQIAAIRLARKGKLRTSPRFGAHGLGSAARRQLRGRDWKPWAQVCETPQPGIIDYSNKLNITLHGVICQALRCDAQSR
jgi:hypothetical protein